MYSFKPNCSKSGVFMRDTNNTGLIKFRKLVEYLKFYSYVQVKYFVNAIVYTLFQNGHHYSVLLFSFKLPLVASFLNLKFKRIFSLERGNKG